MPSIREQVVAAVETAVAGINGAGDYTRTITTVERFEMAFDSSTGKIVTNTLGAAKLPMAIIHAPAATKVDGPIQRVRRRLHLIVEVWMVHDKGDDNISTDELLNLFAADVEIALTVDHTLGGVALNCEVGDDAQMFGNEKGMQYVGVAIEAEITFQNARGNPNSL